MKTSDPDMDKLSLNSRTDISQKCKLIRYQNLHFEAMLNNKYVTTLV